MTSSNHCFVNVRKTAFLTSCLYLPVGFCREHRLRAGHVILLDDLDREWNIELKEKEKQRCYFGIGIKTFCIENKLEKDGEYKVELIKNEEGKPCVMKLFCRKKNYPQFLGVVKSKMLDIPKEFAKKNEFFDKEEMVIKNVRKKRSWKVELKSSENEYCYIGQGWEIFYVANGLKDGDRFKFELVDNGEKPTAYLRFYKGSINK